MSEPSGSDARSSRTSQPTDSRLRFTLILVTAVNVTILAVVLLYLFQPWRSIRAAPPSSAALTGATPVPASAMPPANALQPTMTASTVAPTTAAPPSPEITSPSPTVVLSPTMAVPYSGTTAAPGAGTAVLAQVQKAEAGLHTGQINATMTFTDGTVSSATVRFDLGSATQMPRLYISSTYLGLDKTQTTERIAIGNQAWERLGGGPWTATQETEGAWGPVQNFLPHSDSASTPQSAATGSSTVLTWYDPGRNADVTLTVDTTTGIPQQLRSIDRTTGAILSVVYSGWNSAVQISSPSGG